MASHELELLKERNAALLAVANENTPSLPLRGEVTGLVAPVVGFGVGVGLAYMDQQKAKVAAGIGIGVSAASLVAAWMFKEDPNIREGLLTVPRSIGSSCAGVLGYLMAGDYRAAHSAPPAAAAPAPAPAAA